MTRIGDLANTLWRQGKAGELERELEAIDPAVLPDDECEEWWHLYGITAFESGRDDVALERFRQAHERFPKSPLIRFALGQQYIRAKKPDEGFALFHQAIFPDVPAKHALVEARYAYLYSRYEDARSFIRPFFTAYQTLKILDDNFLYIRGLPFFGRYWNHLAAFSVLSGDWAELDEVTDYVSANCSDYEFDRLHIERDAYRNARATQLLPWLTKRTQEYQAAGASTGFPRMMIAVVEAREASAFSVAQDIVEKVVLAPDDFPWLQDVKTLTIADAAQRFGVAEAERERMERFVERQPLLFEPDIALEFWLLDAQERLKHGQLA